MSNQTRTVGLDLLAGALVVLTDLLNGEQCDHSVGICFCYAFEVRDRLRGAIDYPHPEPVGSRPEASEDEDPEETPSLDPAPWRGEFPDDDSEEPEDNLTDAEADADTLASAGYGTDEDYGYFGGDE